MNFSFRKQHELVSTNRRRILCFFTFKYRFEIYSYCFQAHDITDDAMHMMTLDK